MSHDYKPHEVRNPIGPPTIPNQHSATKKEMRPVEVLHAKHDNLKKGQARLRGFWNSRYSDLLVRLAVLFGTLWKLISFALTSPVPLDGARSSKGAVGDRRCISGIYGGLEDSSSAA
ncbi:hypothetical protein SUGI_0846950 [Cryptomeria japonica]|nr:hypothetical protein SUGI_0846950 [Cryptomeria japonica]